MTKSYHDTHKALEFQCVCTNVQYLDNMCPAIMLSSNAFVHWEANQILLRVTLLVKQRGCLIESLHSYPQSLYDLPCILSRNINSVVRTSLLQIEDNYFPRRVMYFQGFVFSYNWYNLFIPPFYAVIWRLRHLARKLVFWEYMK